MNALFTIGYERATQDGLLASLHQAGVGLLADVRALPLSRRPGFSKSSLGAAVEQAGMVYRHFRHLGTPREGREAARRGDLAGLRRSYEGQLALPEALAQLAQLRALASERVTCLLCFCGEPAKCHRALLLAEGFAGFAVTHLHPAGAD